MKWVSRIHVGKVRENQEDSIGHWPEENPQSFIVADGLGGHADGEVASQTAVDIFLGLAEEKSGFKTHVRQKKALKKANRALWLLNKGKPADQSMATTITTFSIRDDFGFIAHVGDSRIYRYRKGRLFSLTTDHASGRHELTQAAGLERELDIENRRLQVRKNDLYLICSDGLHGMVDDECLTQVLAQNTSLEARAKELLDSALDVGGEDNISFYLIQV